MAAFDITTKPTKLEIKAGSTGSIMVVVSNRTGKPVMGLVEGVLTPASVAKWLISPAPTELQRRYEADPAATVQLEFKVAVPEDAAAQDAQFQASARDVLLPDDTKVMGQMSAIKVIAKEVVNGGGGRRKIPWWVWVIIGVVVVGAGVGIALAVIPRGVPNVVGKTPAEATSILTKKGFSPINAIDTVGKQGKDTNTVVRQDPKAKDPLPKKEMRGKTPATIVVNRPGVEIPPGVVNQGYADAANQLQAAGLGIRFSARRTSDQSQEGRVYTTNPAPGSKVPRGSTVDLVIYRYSQIILTCPPFCVLEPHRIPQVREER